MEGDRAGVSATSITYEGLQGEGGQWGQSNRQPNGMGGWVFPCPPPLPPPLITLPLVRVHHRHRPSWRTNFARLVLPDSHHHVPSFIAQNEVKQTGYKWRYNYHQVHPSCSY